MVFKEIQFSFVSIHFFEIEKNKNSNFFIFYETLKNKKKIKRCQNVKKKRF
jgi:hypothetical protein